MTPRRSALLVLPALALTMTPVHADAAANNWKTLSSISGGKIQGCRVPTAASDPHKFRFRVDARKATTKVQGMVYRFKGETQLSGGWTSSRIARGKVSSIAVVRLPRGSAYSLGVGIGTGAMGNGNTFKAGQLPRC